MRRDTRQVTRSHGKVTVPHVQYIQYSDVSFTRDGNSSSTGTQCSTISHFADRIVHENLTARPTVTFIHQYPWCALGYGFLCVFKSSLYLQHAWATAKYQKVYQGARQGNVRKQVMVMSHPNAEFCEDGGVKPGMWQFSLTSPTPTGLRFFLLVVLRNCLSLVMCPR